MLRLLKAERLVELPKWGRAVVSADRAMTKVHDTKAQTQVVESAAPRVDDDFDSAHSFSKQQQKRIRVIHCASFTFRNEEKHFTFPRLGETNLVVDDEG